MKTLLTVVMLLTGCSQIMAEDRPETMSKKEYDGRLENRKRLEDNRDRYLGIISTRTAIYIIYDLKKVFEKNWGKFFGNFFFYKKKEKHLRRCIHCKAWKMWTTIPKKEMEEIWWEE